MESLVKIVQIAVLSRVFKLYWILSISFVLHFIICVLCFYFYSARLCTLMETINYSNLNAALDMSLTLNKLIIPGDII